MNDTVYVMVATVLGMGIAMLLIWFGYWMGRNSQDLPVRSSQNPRRVLKLRPTPPKPEPEGDIFNDAAFGFPEKDGIPTMER